MRAPGGSEQHEEAHLFAPPRVHFALAAKGLAQCSLVLASSFVRSQCFNRLHPLIPMAAYANPGDVVLFDTPTLTADIKNQDLNEENMAPNPYGGTAHQLAGPLGVNGAVAGDKIAIVSSDALWQRAIEPPALPMSRTPVHASPHTGPRPALLPSSFSPCPRADPLPRRSWTLRPRTGASTSPGQALATSPTWSWNL
jgi:hypothetical protein